MASTRMACPPQKGHIYIYIYYIDRYRSTDIHYNTLPTSLLYLQELFPGDHAILVEIQRIEGIHALAIRLERRSGAGRFRSVDGGVA